MRRIRYQVATSLDGFIAGPNGEYDWIDVDPVAAGPYFKALYAQYDTAVMGRRTFELVRGPVEGMRTYVFSRTLPSEAHKDVTVLKDDDGIAALAAIRAQDGKDIWLYGGGVLFGSLAAAGLVDTVEVGVIPIILGGGIPLAAVANRVKLKLLETNTSLPGIVGLSYSVENPR
jgi:dihydrofolate reductase